MDLIGKAEKTPRRDFPTLRLMVAVLLGPARDTENNQRMPIRKMEAVQIKMGAFLKPSTTGETASREVNQRHQKSNKITGAIEIKHGAANLCSWRMIWQRGCSARIWTAR